MAETNGLLNRRTGKSGTEGSNPSVSATVPDISLKIGRFLPVANLSPQAAPQWDRAVAARAKCDSADRKNRTTSPSGLLHFVLFGSLRVTVRRKVV